MGQGGRGIDIPANWSLYSRSESGYRLYDDVAVERLRFVRRAQGVGLRLEDIRHILEISDEGRVPCEHATIVVDRELSRIAEQLERLYQFRDGLLALRSRMTASTGSAKRSSGCGLSMLSGRRL